MEEISNILTSIQNHVDEEYSHHISNRAISRGEINIPQNPKSKTIWITNVEPQYFRNETRYSDGTVQDVLASRCDAWCPSSDIVIGKNREYARRIMHNFSGHHEVKFNNRLIVFDILNAATYTVPGYGSSKDVVNIKVSTASMDSTMQFSTLKDARKELQDAIERRARTEREAEEAKKKIVQLKKQQEEAERQRVIALQKARDEEERRRIEQAKREEEERLRQQLIEEEKRRKEAEEERNAIEDHLNELANKYAHAASFIRTQASLRLNPTLDNVQDDIKFSHIFDGTTLVINGGPGTGKTTTLIQRLKLLISEEDLRDYRENNPESSLTEGHLQLLQKPADSWIFFSPTELLCQFMKANMEYEGLVDTRNTVVWTDYLRKKLIRDLYQLAGDGCPFTVARSSYLSKPIYKGDPLSLIRQFTRYFLSDIKKRLETITLLDTSAFKWKQIGKKISETCLESVDVNNLKDLCKVMFTLDDLRELPMPAGILTVKQIESNYKKMINDIVYSYIAEWKKDAQFYEGLLALAKTWTANTLTEEEEEETAEEDETRQTANNELKVSNTLRSLLRKLALRSHDSKTSITGRTDALYKMVKDRIKETDYTSLSDYAYFMQNFYPIVHNYESYLFSKIASIYKNFRKDAYKNEIEGWNKDLLKAFVERDKNKPLCLQEQALLIGFINNLVLTINSLSVPRFNQLKHKYAQSYKTVCRPVIGIDEATDYSIMDYYAIYSLRHYQGSTFTLTGDIMQGLKMDGISDWNTLHNQSLFPTLEIKNLTKSYRQSPKLMRVADAIYERTMKTVSPYSCYLSSDDSCPDPLLHESDDEEEKAEWIAQRVLEVKSKYDFVPSIAVFVSTEDDAVELYRNLREDGRLEDSGIDIKNCFQGDNLSATDTLRIFSLKDVKGMEFEVVFFHNINHVEDSDMISKYLYVGLSRATFFMGITTDDMEDSALAELYPMFNTESDWSD